MAIALRNSSLRAALLRADLKDSAGLFDDVSNQEALLDRQCEGLFAIHVTTRTQRVDSDGDVPVVGSADRHDVRRFLIDQLPIITVQPQLVVKRGIEFRQVKVVDIAAGNHLAEVGCMAGDTAALAVATAAAAHADRRDGWPG